MSNTLSKFASDEYYWNKKLLNLEENKMYSENKIFGLVNLEFQQNKTKLKKFLGYYNHGFWYYDDNNYYDLYSRINKHKLKEIDYKLLIPKTL